MSSAAIVAPGACDFFGLGDSSGVALGDGLGVALGSGVGEDFFFFPGEGDGELFGLGVGLGVSDSSGVGLGEGCFLAELLFFFGEGLADGSGVAFFFGDGAGVGDAFFCDKAFRFFGGGVGSKTRLILSPNDCSARARGEMAAETNASATIPPVARRRM